MAHSSKTAFAQALADFGLMELQPKFNEFGWQTPMPATDLLDRLSQSGISAGVDLGRFYEDLSNCVLTCVTEKRSPDDVDRLVKAVEGAI